jgi:hypothetical protein
VPDDPTQTNGYLKAFWICLLVLIAGALIIRISAVILGQPTVTEMLLPFVCLPLLLYALFVLEGLHHVASRVKTADPEGMRNYIADHADELRATYVTKVVDLLQKKSKQFIAGRQICILIIIVLMAKIIEDMQDKHFVLPAFLIPYVPDHLLGIPTHGLIAFPLHNFLITLTLSTLLPCWIAQIVPELMSENRSLDFISKVRCYRLAQLAVAVSELGATWPGDALFSSLSRRVPAQPEIFEIGKASLYERVSASLGARVPDRLITINISHEALRFKDTSSVEYFSGSRTDVGHIVRTYMKHSEKIRLNEASATVQQADQSKPKYGTLQVITTDEVSRNVISDEVVFFIEKKLADPIPVKQGNPDIVCYEFVYEADPLSVDGETYSDFYFDITKPTNRLVIDIICDPGIFAVMPEVRRQPVDDLLVMPEHNFELLRRDLDYRVTKLHGKPIKVEIDYPSVSTRYAVRLDARASEAGNLGVASTPAPDRGRTA